MMHRKNKLSGTERPTALVGLPLTSFSANRSGSHPVHALGKTSWELVFDALAEPVWLMDKECCILQCNRASRKLFGDKIIGKHCWEVVHGTMGRDSGCPYSNMCQSGHRESSEVMVGSRWYSCTVDPLFGDDGKICGAVHVMRDISTDIAGRTRMTETMENERQLLRTLTDQLPDFIFVKDTHHRFLIANKAIAKAYGSTPGHLISRTDADFLPADLSAHFRATEQKVLSGDAVSVLEDTILFPDGQTRTMVTNMTAFRNAQGAVCGLVGIGHDITGRRKAGEALQESEEKFRRLFSTATDGVFILDAETREILDANESALRMYGLGLEDLQHINAMDFTEEPQATNKSIAAAAAGSPLRNVMRWHRKKDGTIFPVEISYGAFKLGGKTLLCGIVRDITARKQAEEALRESEEKFRLIFSAATDGVFILDAQTKQVIDANDAAFRIYGYTRKDLQHVNAMNLSSEPEATQEFMAAAAAGQVWRNVSRMHRKKDGTIFPVEISYGAFKLRGRTLLCGIVRDVTERHQAEKLLNRANRTLQTIRDCHEAMLRATTEQELLDSICQIIVRTGGERMAWVGFAEKDARKSVRPVAATGGAGYLSKVRISWADKRRGQGPVGRAIRTRKVCICHNTQTDPDFAPWRAGARRLGFGSVIALPLLMDSECLGALCIYAPEPNAFDAAEQLMLADLATDITFGVGMLRLRAERERLEDEILKSIEREQERIGCDIHDGLSQLLTGAKLRSAYLGKIGKNEFSAVRPEAVALENILNQAIEQARNLARGLNPVKVTPDGLAAALQNLAASVSGPAGPACFCHIPASVTISDHHVANHLYRIAQEAVQNALKHARAKNISITLARKENKVALVIKDDGTGIPVHLKKAGMGLDNMRTRARLVDGRLDIHRRKGGGTTVECVITPQPVGQP